MAFERLEVWIPLFIFLCQLFCSITFLWSDQSYILISWRVDTHGPLFNDHLLNNYSNLQWHWLIGSYNQTLHLQLAQCPCSHVTMAWIRDVQLIVMILQHPIVRWSQFEAFLLVLHKQSLQETWQKIGSNGHMRSLLNDSVQYSLNDGNQDYWNCHH